MTKRAQPPSPVPTLTAAGRDVTTGCGARLYMHACAHASCTTPPAPPGLRACVLLTVRTVKVTGPAAALSREALHRGPLLRAKILLALTMAYSETTARG
ncbi:hypothetical protein MTO96_019898 [Rhipicephalus appendiculatus]